MAMNAKTIRAAMREAATRGVDPYNSHEVQSRILERRWRMEAGRRKAIEREARREARSEAVANQWLSQELLTWD